MPQLRFTATFAFCFLQMLSISPALSAQDKPEEKASKGKTLFLVARPELGDPIFKEAVVLMFPPSSLAVQRLVVGLIVNRPGDVPLSQIFPGDNGLKNRSETAYFGGPVDPMAPGVLFRSSKPAKQATLLFDDIYVSFDSDFVREQIKKKGETQDLHLFVGRSQWLPEQLQFEISAGAWDSVQAETNLIFSSTPESLWRKLFDRVNPPNVAKLRDIPFDLSGYLEARVRQ